MLKMLKFDFYKIIKSKMLLAFLIITLCFSLINPILNSIVDNSDYSAFYGLYHTGRILYCISWIFIIPFVSRDFSSRYIKNIYPNFKKSDKLFYVLSKVFYIFVLCLIYTLLTIVLEIIFNYIFGGKCVYNPVEDNFTQKEIYLQSICDMLNCVAIGTVYLFLCMIFKKEYIAIIIVVPYIFFLCTILYRAINSAVGGDFSIIKYTIFGVNQMLIAGNVSSMKDYTFIIISSLCYTALFTLLSWLIFRKRSY